MREPSLQANPNEEGDRSQEKIFRAGKPDVNHQVDQVKNVISEYNTMSY